MFSGRDFSNFPIRWLTETIVLIKDVFFFAGEKMRI